MNIFPWVSFSPVIIPNIEELEFLARKKVLEETLIPSISEMSKGTASLLGPRYWNEYDQVLQKLENIKKKK